MKKFRKVITVMLLTALVVTGCGAAGDSREKAPAETADDATEKAPAGMTDETTGTDAADEAAETVGETGETLAAEESDTAGTDTAKEAPKEEAAKPHKELTPDPTNLSYLEEIQIVDFYGSKKEYPLYAPKDGENQDGFFTFFGHGVSFSASVYGVESPEDIPMYLDVIIDGEVESWKGTQDYTNAAASEIFTKGDDRYVFLSAKAEDYRGTAFQKKKLCYVSVRDDACVSWDMEINENDQDEETAPLVDEVARCYGLDLSEFTVEDGTWAQQNAEVEADLQDVYEPEEGESALEKVDGYQYLGMVTLTLDEEGKVTCPVLAPMGRNTTVKEGKVLTTIHGVSVWIRGNHSERLGNYQAEVKKDAKYALKYYNDEEYNYRNGKVSEVMPVPGMESAVYYVVEYEQKSILTEEWCERVDINCSIQIKEKYHITCEIKLQIEDYDGTTNSLLKELETAYGIDLSAWYADE